MQQTDNVSAHLPVGRPEGQFEGVVVRDLGREAWHNLVFDRQWSWDDAEQWLGEQAATALIGE